MKHPAWKSALTKRERKMLATWEREITDLRDQLTVLQASKRRLANTAGVRLIRAAASK